MYTAPIPVCEMTILSTETLIDRYKYYPSNSYPNIHMLVVQQMRVTIAVATINKDHSLEVMRFFNERESNYRVIEKETHPTTTGDNIFRTVGVAPTLEEALKICNTRYNEIMEIKPEEDDAMYSLSFR